MRSKEKKHTTQICIITHSLVDPSTGGERYNWEVVNSLSARGFNLRILTDSSMPGFVRGRRFLAYNLWYIYKFSDKDRFILFTTNYMSPRLLLFCLFSRLFKKVKVFVLVHHLRYHDYESKVLRFLAFQIEKLFLGFSDVLIAISKSTRSELADLRKQEKGIYLVNPGIDLGDFKMDTGKDSDCFNILFVGDCVKRKGLEYLIRALSLLRQENVHLHIAGNLEKDLAYSSRIFSLIKDEGVENRVTFHGRVDEKKKIKLLLSSHVFVLPSLWEGYGIAAAEAMRAGLPVVGTKAGAIAELIADGLNGILVPPKDATSLARALEFLMKNPEVRKGFQQQSLLLSRKFNSWKQVGETIVKIFEQHIR